MNKILSGLITLLVVLLVSCCSKKITESVNSPVIKIYLHISHTRTNTNPDMDGLVESSDISGFDMLWLGGDLAYLTSKDDPTMTHIDSIFDVGNSNTLWALGNHDYSDLSRIRNFTNRPPFYSYHKNGLTFVVLDTQDSLSSIIGAQKDFFKGVVDTIQKSSHLIILHHKLIWMHGNVDLEHQISTISNGRMGDCFHCINPNNFYSDIYPELLEVKKKGIEVLCIAGDIGSRVKEFDYMTSDEIYFLASGISSGTNENKALFFYHDLTTKQLTWKFKLITDLDMK